MFSRAAIIITSLMLALPAYSAELLNIRTGVYKDKTRIVLDLSDKASVVHKKSTGEVKFIINGITNNYTKAPRVKQAKSVSVSKRGNDLSLMFKLRDAATYKFFSLDKPNRIVIDFYTNQAAREQVVKANKNAKKKIASKVVKTEPKKPVAIKNLENKKATKSVVAKQIKSKSVEVKTAKKPESETAKNSEKIAAIAKKSANEKIPQLTEVDVVKKAKPAVKPLAKAAPLPAPQDPKAVKEEIKAVKKETKVVKKNALVVKKITKAAAKKALVARMNELAKGVVDRRILPSDARAKLVSYKSVLADAAAGKKVNTKLLDEALNAVVF